MGLFGSKNQAAPARATQAPRVPRSYYIEILTEAGFPATSENIGGLCRQIGELFLIKSWEFISSRSQAQSEAFRKTHILPRIGTPESNQRILDDLVAWDRDVAPYIDDLHLRVRRILLERRPGTILAAPKTKSLLEFMDERRGG